MKLRHLSVSLFTAILPALPDAARAQGPLPPWAEPSFFQRESGRSIHWPASATAYQLERSSDLFGWTPQAAAMASDGGWESAAPDTMARTFWRLAPAGVPQVPSGLAVSLLPGDLELTWIPRPDAVHYILYIGTSPEVGPGNAEFVLNVGQVSRVKVPGLLEGMPYYFAVHAVNAAGSGAVSAPVMAMAGPRVAANGQAVLRHQSAEGQDFDLLPEGITLTFMGMGPSTGPMPAAVTDRHGRFFFPSVRAGGYFASWSGPGGEFGFNPGMITLGAQEPATALNPLPFPAEPGAVLGRVFLEDGRCAAMDDAVWNLRARAQISARNAQDQVLATTAADVRGGFAFPAFPPAAYPLTLEVTYGPLTASRTIAVSPQPGKSPATQHITFNKKTPRVTRLVVKQNGIETRRVVPGVPVEFSAATENPDALPLTPRWHVDENVPAGQARKHAGSATTFTWPARPAGSSGPAITLATVRLNLSDLVSSSPDDLVRIEVDHGAAATLSGDRYSGLVAAWSPDTPGIYTPLAGARVTIQPAGTVPQESTTQANGSFLSAVNPYQTIATYLGGWRVEVEKPGYMPFLWRFYERDLPLEPVFPLLPLEISTHTFAGAPLPVSHSDGVQLFIHVLHTAAGAPYTGEIRVGTATFDPLQHSPLPPNVALGPSRDAAELLAAGYVAITTPAGEPLVPASAFVAFGPGGPLAPAETMPAWHLDGASAEFILADEATRSAGSADFLLPITRGGLYLLATPRAPGQLPVLAPDRTLNAPLELRMGTSLFTARLNAGDSAPDFAHPLPSGVNFTITLLDLRQGPGLHTANPGASGLQYVSPAGKRTIVRETLTLSSTFVSGFDGSVFPRRTLSLGSSIPGLRRPGARAATVVDGADHFLSRTTNINPVVTESGTTDAFPQAAASDYYDEINAPATLAEWKALNGFPDQFGAPLPGVAEGDYATACYYNLADLGFARAQTMRIKPGRDGLPDVAFYVTNYRSLEEARLGHGAIATVAMDNALRADDTGGLHRHTRFYAYTHGDLGRPASGSLSTAADLDGAGPKFLPGLCVTCHGGQRFTTGGSADLGSRFLPFDLESYTWHAVTGVQKNQLARMNEGVLQTRDEAAVDTDIGRLILGWYGGFPPNTNPTVFNAAWTPPDWPTPHLYEAFKAGCRVCHVSRDAGGIQFSTEAAFPRDYPCVSLQMPHSQRTWGALWGTKAARNLGDTSVIDLMSVLHGDGPGPCPVLPP